jgi:hypothetical protein
MGSRAVVEGIAVAKNSRHIDTYMKTPACTPRKKVNYFYEMVVNGRLSQYDLFHVVLKQ